MGGRPGRDRDENRERPAARDRDQEINVMAHMQMALHMSEYEDRMNERRMIMMAMQHGAGADQAEAEEQRLLQRAIEESKNDAGAQADPNNPDVDRMTYEQLMEMQDKAGQVSRGYSQAKIDTIPARSWYRGRTKEEACLICMENFTAGKKVKSLSCGHEYDTACIDQWLLKEKRCPVCNLAPF